MSLIRVSHLTFGYEGSPENVFEDVSFQMDTDWRLGFTGRNGRGKTTFLRLLNGEYPYQGQIQSAVGFQYFPYEVRDPSCLAIECIGELNPQAEDWEILREASLLQVDADVLYRPFSTLSPGEKTKLLLAAMFLGEERFLLIDEPTNHLDAERRRSIGEYLLQKHGFILVSHDRALLDLCTDHTLSILRTGEIEIQKGNFSVWAKTKVDRDAAEQEENARLKKEIGRLQAASRQTASWSMAGESEKHERNGGLRPDRGFMGHKAAKVMKRSVRQQERAQEAAEKKASLLHEIETEEPLKIGIEPYPKQILISAKDLSLSYGDTCIADGINFDLRRGERLAVTGRNGCGKSTLLRLICGESIRSTGELHIGSGLRISYVSQDTSRLKGSLRAYAQETGADESLLMTILRKMGFERSQFELPIESYSEGQKKKVILAGSLCMRPHIFIWDEPLNYLDVITRMQLESLLKANQATMMFVEHDLAFREQVATKVLEL